MGEELWGQRCGNARKATATAIAAAAAGEGGGSCVREGSGAEERSAPRLLREIKESDTIDDMS